MALRSNIFIRLAEREDLDTVVEWMEDPDFQLFLYGDVTRSQRQIREQIVGLLGRGVAASTRTDPQAKGLGEYLRAKVVSVPAALLDELADVPPAEVDAG